MPCRKKLVLRGAEMIAVASNQMWQLLQTLHMTPPPMISKIVEGEISCGKGPSLATAPAVHNKLLDFVTDIAEKKIPVQWRSLSRSTGTDTDSFAYAE